MTIVETEFTSRTASSLKGSLSVPGDKSISHRSIIFGSLANGTTNIEGFLEGEDALATIAAFKEMGVEITEPKDGKLSIKGVGMHGLKAPRKAIDLGNSGTGMRLFSGLLCAQSFNSTLVGDESLTKRPMSRVAAPLSIMGAQINTAQQGRPPLEIIGGKNLTGTEYVMPIASAQVKSSLLLAGLYAQGETAVIEPASTRDHTERMLRAFSYPVHTDGNRISLQGKSELKACDIEIPADLSSAAFFMVAASIIPDSDILLQHVGINPTRDGVIQILKLMGADIDITNERLIGGETVADIRVQHSELQGIEIPEALVPLAIDEFPVLFIAAACASGSTTLSGAKELRVKESDRIQAMADGLEQLQVKHQVKEDGIVIENSVIRGGKVDSLGDHRIAMAFSVAGAVATDAVVISRCNNVATSFPNFVEIANGSGMSIVVQ